MRKFSLPLFWKFTIAIIFIVAVFGSINVYLLYQSVFSSLEKELDKRALLIVKTLAAQATNPIVYDDIVSLQKLVDDLQLAEPGLAYVFILDNNNRVIAHSFKKEIPEELIVSNSLPQNQLAHSVLIKSKKNPNFLIKDFAYPIIDKSIGIARIGLKESGIRADVFSTLNTLLIMIFVFLLLGILGAFIFSYIITKPIKDIVAITDNFDLNTLQKNIKIRISIREKLLNIWKIPVRAVDELDFLAERFNSMIERLEVTYKDLQNMQASLIQSEKLASIGTLAAGIAHEINNPIAGLQNCLRRINKDPENIQQTIKYLKLMGEAIDRIEKVINGLLNFSRKHEMNFTLISLNNVVENSLLLVGYKLEKSRIVIEKNILGKYFIWGNQNQLEQVLVNLLLNSIDAIEEKHSISPSSAKKIQIEIEKTESKFILTIIDTGIGISQDNFDKIFDPFFTTKATGKGTGLGLAISYNIIKEHGGELLLDKTYLNGTKFIIQLPQPKEENEQI